jgi:hypothetical protein
MARGWVMEDEHDDEGESECSCESDCKCSESLENQMRAMKATIREEMINKLAAEWNDVHTRIEHDSWRSREDRDDEADYWGEICCERMDSAEDIALQKNPNLIKEEREEVRKKASDALSNERRLKESEKHMRLEVIEGLLSDLGARMIRPYEHWNEDERYMEYMESRYEDNDRDYY